MGCCASTPSDDSQPAVRAHSSSRNITTASSTRPSSSHSARASQGGAQPARTTQDPNSRPNSPLKPIVAGQRSQLPGTLVAAPAKAKGRVKPQTDSTNVTWTRSQLDKERGDWWDTQVTGSQEIWGAVRLAAQHLQAGELQEAQTMLDVTGCTCPTGLLWGGVYDATGVQYRVPEWVVVEPEGIVESSDEQGAAGPASAVTAAQDSSTEPGGETVRITARTSHNQKDVVVKIRKRETVEAIVDKLKKQAELPRDARVRLAYGGRLYQDYETLESNPHWDFANEHVVGALVVQ